MALQNELSHLQKAFQCQQHTLLETQALLLSAQGLCHQQQLAMVQLSKQVKAPNPSKYTVTVDIEDPELERYFESSHVEVTLPETSIKRAEGLSFRADALTMPTQSFAGLVLLSGSPHQSGARARSVPVSAAISSTQPGTPRHSSVLAKAVPVQAAQSGARTEDLPEHHPLYKSVLSTAGRAAWLLKQLKHL